jgi:adenosylhomocysteine nucleosidase
VLTIIGALEPELASLRKSLRRKEPLPVDVQVIGIGRESSVAGVDRLLGVHGGDEGAGLLLLGFAGGLDPALKAGDLLMPTCYYHESGDWFSADAQMWQQARVAAQESGLHVVLGNSLTVDHLAATPEDKRLLYRQHQVGSVNMEDYWVAEAASRAGVPFLAVRSVLDPVCQALPGYVLGLTGRPAGVAIRAAARPWRWLALWKLARMRKAARSSLTRFALGFINRYIAGDRRRSSDPERPSTDLPDPE